MKTHKLLSHQHDQIPATLAALNVFESLEVWDTTECQTFGFDDESKIARILHIPGGYIYTLFDEDNTSVFVPLGQQITRSNV